MVDRRTVLKGVTATAAAGTVGGGGFWALNGKLFVPGSDEDSLETLAKNRRDDILSINEDLETALENVSVPTDVSSYKGRGARLTDKFNVAVPEDSQSYNIPREVNGDSVNYTWQEGTNPVGVNDAWEEVKSEIGLGSESMGEFEDVKEEMGNAVLYTATEEGQPNFNESDIEELSSVRDQIDEEFDNVVSQLRELGDKVGNVRGLDTDLRTSNYQKSHRLPIIGEVWGEGYNGSQITKSGVNDLRNGEGPYEGFGTQETLDTGEQAYVSIAEQAARIGLVRELVGQTVADANDQLDQYGGGNANEPPEEEWDQFTATDEQLDQYQDETEGFDQFAKNIEEGSATQNTIYREGDSVMYDNGDVATTIPEEFAEDLYDFVN